MVVYSFGGGAWETEKYTYQKKSNAAISFGRWTIYDIGLDQALLIVEGEITHILLKCDRKFYLNEYGDPTIYDSEYNNYRDYEKYTFYSSHLNQYGVNSIQILNENNYYPNIYFSPLNPPISAFFPDESNSITSWCYYTIAACARNCCYIYMDYSYPVNFGGCESIESWSEGCGYLVKQGNDFFAFLNDDNNHFVLEEWTKVTQETGNEWYAESVRYVTQKGYMSGYSNGQFGPNDNLKRQDFVLILARIAGADLSKYENKATKFSDVKKGSYYYSAVNWATEKKIIGGYANGKFGVNDPITREQICVIAISFVNSVGYYCA